MSTLVLAAAGAAVGSLFGAPQLGWIAGSLLGGYLERKDLPDLQREGPRLFDLKVGGSMYGQAIPIVYGRGRMAGNLIWSSDIIETAHTTVQEGGKGSGPSVTSTHFSYKAHLAVGLCEGPIAGVRKIWADGKLIYNVGDGSDVATVFSSNAAADGFRFYLGSTTQEPDASIEAFQGAGNVPGYRNLAYVVMEDLQLEDFGNRIPNFEFEVLTSLSRTRIAGPVTSSLLLDVSDVTELNTLTHNAVSNGGGLFSNAAVRGDGTYEVGVIGYTAAGGGTALMRVDRDVLGNYAGAQDYELELDFDPAVVWSTARAPAYAQGDIRYQVVDNNASPARWWFLDFELGLRLGLSSHAGVYEIQGATGAIHAAAKRGDHLYLKTFDGTWHWYYVDLSAYVLRATLLGSAAAADLPYAGEDGWYVVSASTIKTYAHGTLTEQASVAFATSGDRTGLARVADGFLVEIRPRLYHVMDDGTISDLGSVASAGAAGVMYGAYTRGVWVSPRTTSAFNEQYENQWYAVAITPGAAPALSTIVQDLCTRSGLVAGDVDVTALTDSVKGFLVGKRAPLRAALEALSRAFFFDAVESNGKIKFVKRGGASALTFDADDLAARPSGEEPPDPVSHQREQDLEIQIEIAVLFFNDGGDYLQGTQYARRVTSEAVGRATVELPIVLSDTEAKRIADAQLFEAWAARDSYVFATSREFAKYEPGDVVTIPHGSQDVEVRIIKRDDGANGVIRWDGVLTDPSVYTQGAATQSVEVPSSIFSVPGPTNLELMDTSLLRDADDRYGFYAAASGHLAGWKGARLFVSRDGGASYDDVDDGIFLTAATMGRADTVLGSVSLFDQFDEGSTVDVTLTSGTLSGVTREQMLNGSNVALLGDELIQFRDATLLSAGKYRLSGLLRARLGTDHEVGGHVVGERFVLLASGSVRFIPGSSPEIGAERHYKGVSIGNTLASAEPEAFTNNGVNLEPLSPVHVGGGRDAAGDLTINWVRRTRLNAAWRDYIDAPLGEDSESYQVDIMNGAAVMRTIAASSPTASYTAAQQSSDFGSPQSSITVKVYQLSSRVGRGFPANATI